MARSWNSPLRPRGRGSFPRNSAASDSPRRNDVSIVDSVLSVTELCEAISIQLDASMMLSSATVRGEVVDPRVHNGHTYFTLRDATSAFECIRWASVLGDPLSHGRLYDVTGKVGLWSVKGQIRLIVGRVREVDAGERQRELEERTERLRTEGLFDAVRKRPLPRWPSRIGVATSADGAVIHDLTTVIGKRMPLAEVVLASCPVQGVGAAGGIISAVRALTRARVDVIVVARGGGSADDLAAFNDEALVRAVREASERSGIPVISAVGHETDTTLCDHAADLRAPTPSAAGEMVVPDAATIRGGLLSQRMRVGQAIERRVVAHQAAVAAADRRLDLASRAVLARVQMRLGALDRAIAAAMVSRVDGTSQRVTALTDRVRAALRVRMDLVMTRVSTADAALRLLSPLRVLERGYAIIEAPAREGRGASAIGGVAGLRTGDAVRLRMHDGIAEATITAVARVDAQ
jgi:exodeoxyribonuclease VII large subunit